LPWSRNKTALSVVDSIIWLQGPASGWCRSFLYSSKDRYKEKSGLLLRVDVPRRRRGEDLRARRLEPDLWKRKNKQPYCYKYTNS